MAELHRPQTLARQTCKGALPSISIRPLITRIYYDAICDAFAPHMVQSQQNEQYRDATESKTERIDFCLVSRALQANPLGRQHDLGIICSTLTELHPTLNLWTLAFYSSDGISDHTVALQPCGSYFLNLQESSYVSHICTCLLSM
jgi:hypothetical protein